MHTIFEIAFRIFFCIATSSLFLLPAKAQDPAYTEAFMSPVYLNPAATGAGDYDLRFTAIYRRQWWLIPSNINSIAFSIDKYLPDLTSGIGLLATRSSAGFLDRSGVYGTYSYFINSCATDAARNVEYPKWFWSGGLQFGLAQTKIDYSKLVFADQLDVNGVILGSTSAAEPAVNSGRIHPDFGAGMFFNYNPSENRRWLIGVSAHHLNRPDESLTSTTVSPVPIKWTGNIMYSLTDPDRTWAFTFGGIGYRQSDHTRYQAGFEATQNSYSNISVGLWYGGSFKKGDVNTIGVTVSINVAGGGEQSTGKMRVGLGHDAQAGRDSYLRTGGSSELGIVWDQKTYPSADELCKPRINNIICPW